MLTTLEVSIIAMNIIELSYGHLKIPKLPSPPAILVVGFKRSLLQKNRTYILSSAYTQSKQFPKTETKVFVRGQE